MVGHILALRQLSCNSKNESNKINSFVKDRPKEQLPENSNNRVRTGDYLSFSSVQEIIHRLLTCDRIILLPHIIPSITKLELSKKLNITTTQLKKLRNSPPFYKKIAKHICLPLADLYCSSTLQQLKSSCIQAVRYE